MLILLHITVDTVGIIWWSKDSLDRIKNIQDLRIHECTYKLLLLFDDENIFLYSRLSQQCLQYIPVWTKLMLTWLLILVSQVYTTLTQEAQEAQEVQEYEEKAWWHVRYAQHNIVYCLLSWEHYSAVLWMRRALACKYNNTTINLRIVQSA